jgi:nitroimidazol reductase NimA-like FMN-containing flavoprotein (pyridoxamine 5'-phosphate oxidase superfamily)
VPNPAEQETKQEIERLLAAHRFAVLATLSEKQPHTSLVAFTSTEGIARLVFATYRSTRKFRGLRKNGRVALFIGDRGAATSREERDRSLLTAHGVAFEVCSDERAELSAAHLRRHPDLTAFLASPEAALVRVDVTAYQLVGSIDDVRWLDLVALG